MTKITIQSPRTFLYFAYGLNLQTAYMKRAAPSAVRKGTGCLCGYRVDFVRENKKWKGAMATIVPHKGNQVFGAIWEVKNTDQSSLYRFNGIYSNYFYPRPVHVRHLEIDKIVQCIVFIQNAVIKTYIKHVRLPPERQPSEFYMQELIRGAKESKLPLLEQIYAQVKTNGKDYAEFLD
nr:unnamed protein product [Callosobruchus analis]